MRRSHGVHSALRVPCGLPPSSPWVSKTGGAVRIEVRFPKRRRRAASVGPQDSRRTRRQDGFTILELAVYVTLFSVILAPLVSMGMAGTKATVEHDTITRLQERNRAALFRLGKELRSAISTTLDVAAGGKELEFTLPGDFQGPAVVPGDKIVYRLELRQDRQDGTGQLVRGNSTTGATAVICSGIELPNSAFERDGNSMKITVSNLGIFTDGSPSIRVSRSVTVFPRN